MGCDIHLFVEKLNKNGEWEIVKGENPKIQRYKEYAENARKKGDLERYKDMQKVADDITSGKKLQEQIQWHKDKGYDYTENDMDYDSPFRAKDWLYDGRNYSLFGILAGVRNYDVEQISNIKGVPEDSCEFIKQDYEQWDCDAHSASYYTFKELLDFDWKTKKVTNEAWVEENVYKQFKETGNPYPCCGGIYGRNIEKITNKEMERILKNKYPWESEKNFYTIITWSETYYEIAKGFIGNIKKYLDDNPNTNTEEIRIVFWFDN